jgi:lytic murein transglycosylase
MFMNPRLLFGAALAAIVAAEGAAAQSPPVTSFAPFLRELWPDAEAQGIRQVTFNAAFAGLTPDTRVVAATRRQPEYGKPFGAYVNSMVSGTRVAMGQRKAAQWTDTLSAVEAKYGVPATILVSIWGIESSYGEARAQWDVIRSLATLAQARFQHPYFRNELISALKILQEGHVGRRDLLGSWAGAMGQSQFMPSSFFNYAVDFTGDGRRDIWTSVPDVLASIAHYLHKFGWQAGLPWGFEVVVPRGFDFRRSRGTFGEWRELGVLRADGGVLPGSGDAILFFPTGASGPAFLVTANFVVLKRYNNSDAYALAVAHLADRIRGLGHLRGAWPADDVQPSRDERIGLQRKLAELGYKVRNFTGHFDFDLRDAIRDMQQKFAMTPDGHPGPLFFERLRGKMP